MDILPRIKAHMIEESYLLSNDIFCHPIPSVIVIFTFFNFLSCLIDHTIAHIIYCCVLLRIWFTFEYPLKLLSLFPDIQILLYVLLSLWFFKTLPRYIDWFKTSLYTWLLVKATKMTKILIVVHISPSNIGTEKKEQYTQKPF